MLSIYAVPVDATTFCGLCRFVTPLTRAKDPTMTAPKKQSSQNAFMFPTSPCEVPEFHHFQTCIASWLNRSQFWKKRRSCASQQGFLQRIHPHLQLMWHRLPTTSVLSHRSRLWGPRPSSFFASTEAPAASSAWTTSRWPFAAAYASGPLPRSGRLC